VTPAEVHRPPDVATAWPRVSIITPSFNQGQFIEETIRSVLFQAYPDLEYIIIDGGSTDGSVATIRKYDRWLAYWVSEPDRGQAHAINKGFARATGQIIAYINSDDVYCEGAFATVAEALTAEPRANWLCSPCLALDEETKATSIMKLAVPADPAAWLMRPSGQSYFFPQQGVFLRKNLVDEVGLFREDLHYSFDYEYFLRILLSGHRPIELDTILAMFRLHGLSKTTLNGPGFTGDDLAIADLYFDRVLPSYQRRVVRQRHEFLSWRILDGCSSIARMQGPRAARRALRQRVMQDPRLLRYRAVWGAFRRWYGLGPA